jgi:hypothetical protein
MKRKTSTARVLRRLLSDGEWHTGQELVLAGVGFRYGDVLHAVRHGWDGLPPLAVESKRDRQWLYRVKPEVAA